MRAQLDEPQRRLAPGDDGVHAGAVAVVGTDAAVAVAVERGRVTARAAVALAGDQIDERRFLGLLHGLPLLAAGHGCGFGLGTGLPGELERSGVAGFGPSIRGQTPIAKRELCPGHARDVLGSRILTLIRRSASPARSQRAQRPWHFLYLAPEPHQHGSLRPIRAPVGVKPGPGAAARSRAARRAGRRRRRRRPAASPS